MCFKSQLCPRRWTQMFRWSSRSYLEHSHFPFLTFFPHTDRSARVVQVLIKNIDKQLCSVLFPFMTSMASATAHK